MRRLIENNRIIHALDIKDLDRALEIAKMVEDYIDAIKVSQLFVLRNGLRAINKLRESVSVPILTCFKTADIPKISKEMIQEIIDAGADGVTVHGFVGRDVVKECIRVANQRDAYVFVITEMSHPGALDFMQKIGVKIAKMAKELNARGIVAPATRPSRVGLYRKIVGNDMLIICPGIGAQGGKLGDAILEGANFEIIGRSIYMAKDPRHVTYTLCSQLKVRLEEISKATQYRVTALARDPQ
ncbi:MAG: orotidine-5'-phosphate decarboxylase [archaeon]|nr:orotidine-5'-phosphate decarboxylase [archaeon]MCP8320550.1 orotidine-5'-phosphate decarboxylase [archaeon]